jgi:hypothetical protein
MTAVNVNADEICGGFLEPLAGSLQKSGYPD